MAQTNPQGRSASGRDGFPEPGPAANDADQQAAEWLIRRLGEDWSPAAERDLQQWLRASPQQAAAYAHAERTWSELGALRESPELLSMPTDPALDALVPDGPAPARWRRRALFQGLAAVALVAVVVIGGNLGDPMLVWRADYRTAVSEGREVALPDGSRLTLAGDSAVAVRYSDAERRIELLKGEALFEAKPLRADASGGERRPFVVDAGGGVTRALGTRFIVERLSGRTQVTGVEHQVSVAVDSIRQPAVVLSPGQVVRYDPRGIEPVEAAGFDAGQAWARGLLVFERAPLADVVARLNRNGHGRIVVTGEALEKRPVSGVFPATDGDGALQAIAHELHVRVLRLPGLTVIY